MYEFKADMRNKSLDSVYVVAKGGDCYALVFEEYENKEVFYLTSEQMEKIDDDYRKEIGEPTHAEQEDKEEKTEVELEKAYDLIGQYQEHEDAQREKYFNSEWIV